MLAVPPKFPFSSIEAGVRLIIRVWTPTFGFRWNRPGYCFHEWKSQNLRGLNEGPAHGENYEGCPWGWGEKDGQEEQLGVPNHALSEHSKKIFNPIPYLILPLRSLHWLIDSKQTHWTHKMTSTSHIVQMIRFRWKSGQHKFRVAAIKG